MQLSLISLALTKVYGGVAAFSPSSLFASGEQGAWYDPSDLSTMFQDSTGTTPVTADGQPVGLILDKSKGLALGPELATNGDFSVGTGWTLSAGFTISDGKLNVNSSSGSAINTSGAVAQSGEYYRITFTVDSISGGTVYVALGGWSYQVASAGTYTIDRLTSSNNYLVFGVSTGTPVAVIDNASFKLVSGNHATQATAASRPLYKTDGTYHWLQFDGVDDSLSTAIFPIAALDGDCFSGLFTTAGNIAVWLTQQPAAGYWAVMQSGSGASPTGSVCGAPSYLVDGVDLVAPTRDTLLAAVINRKAVLTTKALVFGSVTPTGLSVAGYAGFSFTGNIYSIIVRGALSTADEITATETWVNSKTGAY